MKRAKKPRAKHPNKEVVKLIRNHEYTEVAIYKNSTRFIGAITAIVYLVLRYAAGFYVSSYPLLFTSVVVGFVAVLSETILFSVDYKTRFELFEQRLALVKKQNSQSN